MDMTTLLRPDIGKRSIAGDEEDDDEGEEDLDVDVDVDVDDVDGAANVDVEDGCTAETVATTRQFGCCAFISATNDAVSILPPLRSFPSPCPCASIVGKLHTDSSKMITSIGSMLFSYSVKSYSPLCRRHNTSLDMVVR